MTKYLLYFIMYCNYTINWFAGQHLYMNELQIV